MSSIVPLIEQMVELAEEGLSLPLPDDGRAAFGAIATTGRQALQAAREGAPVLGLCPHGVDLDRAFCPEGCRV